MKFRSITLKLMLMLIVTGIFFSVVPNMIVSNFLFKQYDLQVHKKNQEILNTVVTEFMGELMAIESVVDTFTSMTRSRFGGEGGFVIPDLDQEELVYEQLFGEYLASDKSRSTSLYIYYDPSLDDAATHDVWMHENGGAIIREDEYDWDKPNLANNANWFYGPKEKGYSYWVDPYRNRFNEHITSYVSPVIHKGEFIGIIGMYLELDNVKEVVADLSYYEGDMFWVYNAQGEVIYHPNHEEGALYQAFTNSDRWLSEGILTIDQVDYYAYAVELTQGWTFNYSIPTDSISAVHNRTFTLVLLVFAITLGAISIFIFFIAKRYRRIFTEIISALSKIKDGQLNHRIVRRTNDEIGLMVDAINESNASLSKVIDEKFSLAYYNNISQAPNRNKLIMDLQAYLDHDNSGQPLALVYVDIDQFQAINDLLGYSLGDSFIQMIAIELKKILAKNMDFYHTRIDEFVYLIKGDITDDALRIFGSSILSSFGRNINFVNHRFYVTLGLGVVRMNQGIESIEDVFRAADIALNEAKKKGRNQMAIYDDRMYEQLLALNEMERDFAIALMKDEFILHFQAKVNLGSGSVDAMEALVRWQHPKKGLVFPGAFIEFAEKSGLIIALGEVVLNKVCRQLKAWQASGEPDRSISVNISLRQVMENDFVESIQRIVEENQVKPEFIELEITESMFIGDSQKSIDKVIALKQYGFRIAMDDFGSGYSALSSVNAMPLDTLKIDRSLIQDCTEARSIVLIETIIDMARRLDLDVVAEGVEDHEQKVVVKSLGCKYIQGYYYAKPLPVDDFIDYCNTFVIDNEE